MTIYPVLQAAYIRARRVARSFLRACPTIDGWVGRRLVLFDEWFRSRSGLGRGLTGGAIEWRGLRISSELAGAGLLADLRLNDDYEPETREAIEQLLFPDATFVDLGAHIGYFSLLAAGIVGSGGRVYAFEPSPQTFAQLQANLRSNGFLATVTALPLAVAERVRTGCLVLYPQEQANALLAEPSGVCTQQTIVVEVTSLDVFFRGLGWPRVDLVKLDIEGAEYDALRGMLEVLRKNSLPPLIFEYHKCRVEQSKRGPSAIFELLRATGYERFLLLHRGQLPIALPEELPRLLRIASRANVNILCQPSP